VAASAKIAARVRGREPTIPTALLGDERLARLVARGGERAFQTIYDRYHQRLYRYCYSLLRNSDDAYDALQSTLARALAALQREQRDAPLRPWLFRIAHNEAISEVRRRERGGEVTETLATYAPSSEDRAGERARLALLGEDLRELPARERSALLMCELSGLSHREIAIALGISIHAVRHAILSARRTLVESEEGRAMMCAEVRRSISHGDARVLARARARAHMRDCAACAAFAAAIPARRADLQVLAPPLAPVLAAGLLVSLHGTASAPGSGGGVAAGIAGKTVGATFAAKALVGVAIVASAGASIAGAVNPTERNAGQRSAGHVAPAGSRGRAGVRHERPARTRASRERPVTSVRSTVNAASSTPSPSAASAGAAGTDTGSTGSPGAHPVASSSELEEVGRSANRPPSEGEKSKPRPPGGPDRRSATGAQHARGPSRRSDPSVPLRGSEERSVAASEHARAAGAPDATAARRGEQSGQPSPGGNRATPPDAPPQRTEGRGGGAPSSPPKGPPPSAAEGAGGQAEPARAVSHEESPIAQLTPLPLTVPGKAGLPVGD
jgi:RNA polymerase sigma factor (sigma-70 family)